VLVHQQVQQELAGVAVSLQAIGEMALD